MKERNASNPQSGVESGIAPQSPHSLNTNKTLSLLPHIDQIRVLFIRSNQSITVFLLHLSLTVAMATNEDFQGVSNCYVFKSRLQEYAQKVGLPTPVYETIKEGPSHEPSFRSTVIVNDVRYDSLPGFFNRKAAEQSAAEVALLELAKSDEVKSVAQPVHETGLCKNLLQEYAQKMNYAMPVYQCKKDETPSRAHAFTCTVDIGGILYIGGAAKTKKEAEIKAARTALLAIQSSPSSQNQLGHSQFTVIPCRKRVAESVAGADETSNAPKPPKPKKARFKKKSSKRKFSKDTMGHDAENVVTGANIFPLGESHVNVNDESGSQETKSGPFTSEVNKMGHNAENVGTGANVIPVVELHANVKDEPGSSEAMNSANGTSVHCCKKETLSGEVALVLNGHGSCENGNSIELRSRDDNIGSCV